MGEMPLVLMGIDVMYKRAWIEKSFFHMVKIWRYNNEKEFIGWFSRHFHHHFPRPRRFSRLLPKMQQLLLFLLENDARRGGRVYGILS